MEKGIGKLIKNEEGATSVLIIFMMIVLVTLGAFAITSSNVNYKFSQKAFGWNKMYYALESQAEQYVMDVDVKLSEAEAKAVEYALNRGYESASYEGVPSDLQRDIYSAWTESSNKKNIIYFAMQQVYMSFANEGLQTLLDTETEYDGIRIENGADFVSEENNLIHLKVSLQVEPISNFQVAYAYDKVTLDMTNTSPRYRVVQWYQWQESEETETRLDLWDGGINPDVPKGEGIFDNPNAQQNSTEPEEQEDVIIEEDTITDDDIIIIE